MEGKEEEKGKKTLINKYTLNLNRNILWACEYKHIKKWNPTQQQQEKKDCRQTSNNSFQFTKFIYDKIVDEFSCYTFTNSRCSCFVFHMEGKERQ